MAPIPSLSAASCMKLGTRANEASRVSEGPLFGRPLASRVPGIALLSALGAILAASGCVPLPLPPTPTPIPNPTPWPTPSPEPLDTGWRPLRPGADIRWLLVETVATPERLTIVRIDPATVRFRVHYDRDVPRQMSDWADRTESWLVVNGGYFTPENEVTGLIISDGQAWGTPYGDFAGMFGTTPGGAAHVRWLATHPYDPAETLAQAVQSFPVLVKPGGVMGFPADADEALPARRTVVAQDIEGRILFIVAPRGSLSLHALSAFLTASDLALDVALNLDGGNSTGLWLIAGKDSVMINSRVPIPSVISADHN